MFMIDYVTPEKADGRIADVYTQNRRRLGYPFLY